MTGPAEIRDFTKPMEPHRFRIGDDVFAAPAILSPIVITRIASQVAGLDTAEHMTQLDQIELVLGKVSTIFRALLPGRSGEIFAARLNSEGKPAYGDPESSDYVPADPVPIDLMGQAIPALYFLLECYGLRPTAPSSPLPSGSTEATTGIPSDGTSSTDGA